MPKYDYDYFIRKFNAIPGQNWTTGQYVDPLNPERKCAFGHCGAQTFVGSNTEECQALSLLWLASGLNAHIADINDFPSKLFPQEHPKERILAALQLLKEEACSSKAKQK